MSEVTKPIVLDETARELNRLIAHQNASIDLLAADKRAELITDISTLALLSNSGEILEVMDYGDQMRTTWKDGETEYEPMWNLCHEADAELEDGESIHGTFWEMDKTLPFAVPFDEPEALYVFDGTEGARTFYIEIGTAYGEGWHAGDGILFTATEPPSEGDQFVVECGGDYNNDPTAGRTWHIYAAGSATPKQSGTTSKGTSGTLLGSTDATSPQQTNGRVNAISRSVYGYNRWSQSALRQFLNVRAPKDEWWTMQNIWDRPSSVLATHDGLLMGFSEDVIRHFKPIKVVTVANNYADNVEDITYDRVFLSSLEQMYCTPQFPGKEGEYWEYYRRLLGRTTPAPTSQTYPRLIKRDLAQDLARYCFRRSAARGNAGNVWRVTSSGGVYANPARLANFCAPGVFLS